MPALQVTVNGMAEEKKLLIATNRSAVF